MITFLLLLFILSASLTWVVKLICFKFNILDVPNQSSSHSTPKALMGGAAIVDTFIIGIIVLYFKIQPAPFIETSLPKHYLALLVLAIVIAIIGLIDDIYDSNAKIRFILHAFISLISAIILFYISSQAFSVFNAILIFLGFGFILGTLNIYNFMDGIDGIAAGSGIIFAAFFAIVAKIMDIEIIYYPALILIAAQLGFLIWNFPPAKIFMGDVGSTFLGFCFAIFTLLFVFHGYGLENIFLGTTIMMPFLFDGAATVIIRGIKKEPLFEAHRDLLYQRLHKSGWSHLQVTNLYLVLILISGSLVLTSIINQVNPLLLILYIPVYAFIYFGINKRLAG